MNTDMNTDMYTIEGNGDELVKCVPGDLDMIQKAKKDALGVFAKKKFGYDPDLGAMHIKELREELTKKVKVALNIIIDKPGTPEAEKKAIEKVIPKYLLHPVNKRVNPVTPELLARKDMIPCTQNGTPLISQSEIDAITGGNRWSKVSAKYLLHPFNGRINIATPELIARGDMVPCDENGKALVDVEENIVVSDAVIGGNINDNIDSDSIDFEA